MKKNKLHILFLNSWYPNRLQPQNGNFIKRHAAAVARKCNVSSLHVIADHGVKNYEMFARHANGFFEVLVYYPKSKYPWRKFFDYITAHKIGFERIKKELGNVDITHLNVTYRAGIFALHLKNKLGIPYLVTEHWTAFLPINPKKFSWLEKFWIKKVLKKASYVCPVSYSLQLSLQNIWPKSNFKVIPNVIDTSIFTLKEKQNSSLKRILHVSTLSNRHKNIHGIFEVIKELSKKRNDFHLTLVGNNFADEPKKYAKSINLQDKYYTIIPEVGLEKIANYMQNSDLFLLFSNYENLPCVVSEAHACGLPVLSSDVGGVKEMIDISNGVIVKYQDKNDLLLKLDQMLDRLEEYNAEQISLQAQKKYSYDSVANEYKALYDKMTSK